MAASNGALKSRVISLYKTVSILYLLIVDQIVTNTNQYKITTSDLFSYCERSEGVNLVRVPGAGGVYCITL